ncbi:MAG: hypothetical protein AAFN93_05230 [Bacteroidota bacterium]
MRSYPSSYYCLMKSGWWLLLFIPYLSIGQRQVQVVTKTIVKKLDFTTGQTLTIQAEKASIDVSHWRGKYIQVSLKLISKHPNQKVAERELNYLKYDISNDSRGHEVKNYFEADNNSGSVKGSLSAIYNIKLPLGCALDITNLYGLLNLNGIKSDLKGRFKFVDVQLSNHKGKGEIESFFSELTIENFKGELEAKLEKSDMKVVAFDGELKVKSNYGEIEIDGGNHDNMDIDGNRTRITFKSAYLEKYNYEIKNMYGEIELPSVVGATSSPQDNGLNEFERSFGASNQHIGISTSYSPIIIKQIYNADNK